jgi:sRNA-binding carbon storage regulator CsrA
MDIFQLNFGDKLIIKLREEVVEVIVTKLDRYDPVRFAINAPQTIRVNRGEIQALLPK